MGNSEETALLALVVGGVCTVMFIFTHSVTTGIREGDSGGAERSEILARKEAGNERKKHEPVSVFI